MKITVLAENTAVSRNFEYEHGLSLYIETNGAKILFDMGQTEMFVRNAERSGIDLREVDFAVLSHGHYDHGGGLGAFLGLNKKAPVYLSRHAFEPHYNGREKYIGLDTTLSENPRLIPVDDCLEITEGISLHSKNNEKKNHDLGSFGLNMISDVNLVPDDFRHEQYLLIKEQNKKILISGCSHKGIMDITEWFTPEVLVGGFHFSKLPPDDTLAEYAHILNSLGTEYFTCHCTGKEQFEFMKKHMNKLHYISSGEAITI